MMTVIGCILFQHDLLLVLLAASICAAGSWSMARLFLRASTTVGLERVAWVILSAFVTGASIWSTHFVAMLGYEVYLPVTFDPVLTIVSLLIAMLGSGIGFMTATMRARRAPAIGGMIVGLSIAVMHYTGMLAYRVSGLVSWDHTYLIASILVSCTFSGAAFHWLMGERTERSRTSGAALMFVLSVVGLHFTGMTAFRVSPLTIELQQSDPQGLTALGIAVACVGLLVIGAGFISSFIDLKARAAATDALSNMSNGLVMLSPAGTITLFNDRVTQLFALQRGDISVGMSLPDFIDTIGRQAGWDEARTRRVLSNHEMWMRSTKETRVEKHFDNGTILSVACQPMDRGGAILTYEDVTEARNGQKTIAHMAFQDALTGLQNRRKFSEVIEDPRDDGDLVIMMIDLDRFKQVNDRYGHAVGDELLRQVADRLTLQLGSGDEAFRLGGDELAIAMTSDLERAAHLAERIIEAMSLPFEVRSHRISIGCSIGIATSADMANGADLQRMADLALYTAKDGGRGRFEVYRPGMLEAEANKLALEEELSMAVSRGQLELWYQPLFRLPEERLAGFEALIRWRHPERGLVSPIDFIPLAETSGLITAIGAWIIDAACEQAAKWPDDLYVSINVSAVQLHSASLPMQISKALSKHGLSPKRVEIEITETAMVENSEQIDLTIAGLRAIGVRIAMDDFGTGYSSLAHLKKFKVDRIKVDRSFVAASGDDKDAAAIVRAVISMARELSIDTTAEGIEEDHQLQSIVGLGCGTAQGYLFGRPLDVSDVGQLLASRGEARSASVEMPANRVA